MAISTLTKPETAPSHVRRWLTRVFVLAVLGASAVAMVHTFAPNPVQSSLAPALVQPPAVVGLGYLEPVGSIIRIGAPGSPDALKIGALLVNEGDEVSAGQVLATLDTLEKIEAQVTAAETVVALKRLIWERQNYETAFSIVAKRASLERAQAELEAARAESERQSTLLDRSVSTPATLEKRRKDYLTAQASVREMEAALKRAEAVTADEQPVPIDVAVAAQEIASAEADLRVQRLTLEQAKIRAPVKGRVLSLKARSGERIGQDGLLEMGATERMRAVIEVYQTDIARVRAGQAVELRADALGQSIRGAVERIGVSIKRQSVINNDPATATDGRVVEVFVALDPETSRLVSSLSRLQVTGVFAR